MDEKLKKEIEEYKKAKDLEERQKNYINYCAHHPTKPMSRRELLGAGVLGFSASLTLPSLASLFAPSRANAQEVICADANASTGSDRLPPFVSLNLAGGAALAANFVPMDAGGQPLSTYNEIGLGSVNNLVITRDFANNAPFAGNNVSQFYAQLVANTSAATRAKVSFIGMT